MFELGETISDEELQEMIEEADRDGDGEWMGTLRIHTVFQHRSLPCLLADLTLGGFSLFGGCSAEAAKIRRSLWGGEAASTYRLQQRGRPLLFGSPHYPTPSPRMIPTRPQAT